MLLVYPTLPRFSSFIPHSLPVHSFPSLCLSRVLRNVSLLFCPFDPPCADYLVPSSGPVLHRRRRFSHGAHPPVSIKSFIFASVPCSFIPVRRVCSRVKKKKRQVHVPWYDDRAWQSCLSFWPFLLFRPPSRPSDIRQLNYSPAGFIGGATGCSGCRPNCPSGEVATGRQVLVLDGYADPGFFFWGPPGVLLIVDVSTRLA